MLIQVKYSKAMLVPEYTKAKADAATFWQAHPRLSFEPRSIQEHADQREYQILEKAVQDLEANKYKTVVKTGILVQVIDGERAVILVDGLFEEVLLADITGEIKGVDSGKSVHSGEAGSNIQTGNSPTKV